MSLHRYLLTGALLAMSVCQAQSGGMREGTTATPKRRLQPWLVGLAAVAGFLFLVFIVLIVKRLVYGRDENEDSKGYDNKDAESVSSVDEDDTKQTVL